MSVVCWTRDTNPIRELDAYKRAYEDERGHEIYDVERFELRCSPSFWRWMMALPRMEPVRDALAIERASSARLRMASTGPGFYMLDNVRVVMDHDVDGGEARLSAVSTEQRALPLFTISAVMP